MKNRIDDLIEFPTQYIFKIIGINTQTFKDNVIQLFHNKKNKTIKFNLSRSNKYLSVTVEVEILDKEELLETYDKIKKIEGITYFL
ncbi:DUF493 domain-containing protein [Deferribacter thermophilus]|uniref:HP0495 family protein n=1 Tax=Deferribacter thermophilus TaxID=53573 RepID=UPI003C2010B2